MSEPRAILATDCGSTTTKAILIEKIGEGYRLIARGEAPTTVEAPFEDVMIGVRNAIQEVEELVGGKYLNEQGNMIVPAVNVRHGADIYVSTSSAGGGLQMLVGGVVKEMTAESAQRAALGAGAIVVDVLAINDGRLPHQRVERIRKVRPDMILLAGGTDGGDITHVVGMAEVIAAANPRPRLGATFKLPLLYAGNKEARTQILQLLEEILAVDVVDNIRPVLERENLFPTRWKIQELFLHHVMSHAPGYRTLMEWVSAPIMPTPAAVGKLIEMIGKEQKINVMGVDIGGATTDVFSYFVEPDAFNRTVSANYGLSYSISNVLADAGAENVTRWIPFPISEEHLRNQVKNKMIRPTTIPQTIEDLLSEQALAREALRMSLDQHRLLAVGLKGIQQERTISDTFAQTLSGASLIDMMKLDLLVGSGGVLSHAPRRVQAALMLIDAFQPEGFTRLAVDSIFMMPHLGVLSEVHPKAALEVFDRDCLIRLGTVIAPSGSGMEGEPCLSISIHIPGHPEIRREFAVGEMVVFPLRENEEVEVVAQPMRKFDLGGGKGKKVVRSVTGGVVGIIVDTRGRPLTLPSNKEKRSRKLGEWFQNLECYPEEELEGLQKYGTRVYARA